MKKRLLLSSAICALAIPIVCLAMLYQRWGATISRHGLVEQWKTRFSDAAGHVWFQGEDIAATFRYSIASRIASLGGGPAAGDAQMTDIRQDLPQADGDT